MTETEARPSAMFGRNRRRRRGRWIEYRVGVRFAFYGRMSTREFQHRETSRAWQREVAEATIAGRGVVLEEFFDEGCSRRSSWWKRPAAAALLAAAGRSDCGFDAVIVGEYERAFCGNQFREVMGTLNVFHLGSACVDDASDGVDEAGRHPWAGTDLSEDLPGLELGVRAFAWTA